MADLTQEDFSKSLELALEGEPKRAEAIGELAGTLASHFGGALVGSATQWVAERAITLFTSDPATERLLQAEQAWEAAKADEQQRLETERRLLDAIRQACREATTTRDLRLTPEQLEALQRGLVRVEFVLEQLGNLLRRPLAGQGQPQSPLRALARDVIDFTLERSRHTSFFGREDVLAAIDAALSDAMKARGAGFIVLKGGPGMGKSAILSEWLRRREEQGRNPRSQDEHGGNPRSQDEQGGNPRSQDEQGGNPRSQDEQGRNPRGQREPGMGTPHHFIRRGQGSSNQPDVVVRNLVAQIAALHPRLVEAEPALVDPEAAPQRQLEKLLLAVSQARSCQAENAGERRAASGARDRRPG